MRENWGTTCCPAEDDLETVERKEDLLLGFGVWTVWIYRRIFVFWRVEISESSFVGTFGF